MNHWIVAPIVLPALMAPAIVIAARHDLVLQRVFSIAASVALFAIAVGLAVEATGGPPQVYELGDWQAPFGIVMVLDRLSALMVLLTGGLAVLVSSYAAASGWDARGRHFHALFQFQLMGIAGAFLTGDVFNLFVFFEVLLIASYGLMLHGGGAKRLKAGVQYVVINLTGSTLFLFAVGTIYGVTGTLNMADLAVKVPQTGAADMALLKLGGLLLLLVFAVKAALVPLHFWLPGTYANAPAPVAALFAIMTKVGAYAILRVYTLIFGAEAGALSWLAADWLLPAALVTLALGMIGVLGARDLMRLACYAVIGSMGTLMTAIALFTPTATTAALYYLIHSTLAAAALFLVADLVLARRGRIAGAVAPAPPIAQWGLIASLFLLGAIGMTGMPPLSGFIGKLLVLDAARAAGHTAAVWAVVLATSVIAVVGFARAGSTLFWKTTDPAPDHADTGNGDTPPARGAVPLFAAGTALAAMVALAIFAGPVTRYLEATTAQLYDTDRYIGAVLGPERTADRQTARREGDPQ